MSSGTGKVALVTGASAGMGKEIAKNLLRDGYTVYVAARRLEKMKDLESQGAHALKMDITKDEDIVALVDTIKKSHGGIDVLINNAGFGSYGSVEDTTIEDARYQFEVNLFGLARLTQLALPYMREKKAGKIVNISSMGGKIYTPLGAWYHATKHALEGWSDCLRLELAEFDIDVVIVEPGIIRTEFGDVLVGPMLERSGKTAYARLANMLADTMKKSAETGAGSPAGLIADIVSKALKARKPKTRYLAGQLAKPLVFVRNWFGDRIFDKAVMSQVS